MTGIQGQSWLGFSAGGSPYIYPDATNRSIDLTLRSASILFQSGIRVDVTVVISAAMSSSCFSTALEPAACLSWTATGFADFGHTAVLVGIDLFDEMNLPIDRFRVTGESGTLYSRNGVVPDPPSRPLVLLGILAVIYQHRQRNSTAKFTEVYRRVDMNLGCRVIQSGLLVQSSMYSGAAGLPARFD
jgi:hypothetical protein